jgi:integrase/recombinase XerD
VTGFAALPPADAGRSPANVMPGARHAALKMIQRRARQAGVLTSICCHSFRATGITNYLLNGGTLEKAQKMANHESAKTTKLYDRRDDDLTLDEVERITI